MNAALRVSLAKRRGGAKLNQEAFMDVFWLIPAFVIIAIVLGAFFAYLHRQPVKQGHANVLFHREADHSAVDEMALKQDWGKRPCGSFLEWLSRDKK